MTRHFFILALLVMVAAGAGCHGMCRSNLLCPFGPGCDPSYCCDTCWGAHGRAATAECDGACEESCEPDCGTSCGPAVGPLTWVFRVFSWRPCGGYAGCGETYWGDWCSEPPHCCDPCDRCGNWIGANGQGTGYSSMYPGGGLMPGGAYAAEGEEVAPMAGASSPGCNCGQSHASRALPAGQPRTVAQPQSDVTRAAYQPMTQRPSQPYRNAPVRR